MEKFVEGLDAFTQRLGRSQTEEAGPALHFELEFLKIDGFIERFVDLTCAAADLRAEMERERAVDHEHAEADADDEGEQRMQREPLHQMQQPRIEQEVVQR